MPQRNENFAAKVGRVGVFMGGRSRERSISLRSGQAVFKALAQAGFRVAKIDTANGYKQKLSRGTVDFAFPALHGVGGEDGTIQRELKKRDIPHVGSSGEASACAFDKFRAKQVFVRANILTPKFELLLRRNWKRVLERWRTPYVIKPVSEGSSIGVIMSDDERPKTSEIKKLFKHYGRLLIEEKIKGRELTVGVIGNKALPVVEVRTKRRFYDYKAKYTKGLTDYLVPAPISKLISKKLQRTALKAHRALALEDMSRVDFILSPNGKPYVLEVNSIPGFTETSLLPKAATCFGMDFKDLCSHWKIFTHLA